MKAERVVVGLDIGSARTTAIVAEAGIGEERRPTVRVLGVGQARTTGLRRGMVADIEETTRVIRSAIEEAARVAGVKVDSAYVGIASTHVEAMTSNGVVAVSGDEITRADVDRANAVARAQALPQDRELLHAIPQEYAVDKNTGIHDPVGMVGTRLETEVYLVSVGSSPAMNLRKAVDRAGCKVRELVLEPLASALCVLSEEEKELGVALVDMGAASTDLAIFHEGKIRHLGTVAYGGGSVTSDIVHGLGVTQAEAERLKERFGCAYEPLVDPAEVIELPGTATMTERHVPRELLSHIIHQRTDEIFDLVQRDITRAGFSGKLSSGVVLTGGGAAVDGILELASDVFASAVRVGTPADTIGGLLEKVSTPRYATALGLALYGAHRMAIGGATAGARRPSRGGPGVDKIAQRVRNWLQDFF